MDAFPQNLLCADKTQTRWNLGAENYYLLWKIILGGKSMRGGFHVRSTFHGRKIWLRPAHSVYCCRLGRAILHGRAPVSCGPFDIFKERTRSFHKIIHVPFRPHPNKKRGTSVAEFFSKKITLGGKPVRGGFHVPWSEYFVKTRSDKNLEGLRFQDFDISCTTVVRGVYANTVCTRLYSMYTFSNVHHSNIPYFMHTTVYTE